MKIERITIEPITADGHDTSLRPGYVRINGQPTTQHLESALWTLLRQIAHEQSLTLDELCSDIADVTATDASFADAARAYVLGHIANEIPTSTGPKHSARSEIEATAAA
jgi:predicted DNA-binding ribbon-helix-helix protein